MRQGPLSFAAALMAVSCMPAWADPPNGAPPEDGNPISAVVPLDDAYGDILNEPLRSPVSPLRLRAPTGTSHALGWDRAEKSDGSTAVTVKKTLPLAWDAKIGADFALAPPPGTNYLPDRPLPWEKHRDTGAAWANIAVPGFVSLEARLDPAKDQGKLGTTFSRSLPLGSDFSLTLKGSYAVTDTLGMNAPAIAGAAPSPVWSNERLVKFNILSTGTSLVAGTASNTAENVTRNKFSAEQKLFEHFNVTTTVTDVGGANASKSVTAGFKWKW